MAEKQAPSRRGGASTQNAPRRNDVIRCDKCGEYYATTYKRCPFCDERPGRGEGSGRRVANTRGGGYGGPVNPVQVVALVISLVLIIAALFIVFTKLLPLFTQDKDGGSSSAGTSQSTSIGGSTSTSSPDGSSPNSSQSGGDQSEQPDPQPDPEPVAVSSLTLNKSDITLQANETFEFVVKVDPADATVAWSSSDESALTVTQDGMITNVNTTGDLVKVTVTATAGDKTAQCTVYCRGSGTSSSGSTGGQSGNTGSTGGSTGTTGTIAPNTPGTIAPNTPGTIAPNTPATIVNAENGLNIRSGPGKEYDVVASASNGAKITVLEETNGWCKFDYGGGKIGYISKDYVSVG